MQFLDPDAVEAFVLVAELRSFTRAAQAMNTTQAAISLRIKRLEARIGQRLLERTPRHMRLSAAGERFLEAARDLVAAQRRASAALLTDRRRLAIGITHHVVGPNLPRLLRRMGALDSGLTLDLRVAETRGLLDLYDAGELDAVIVLRHDESRRGGETLMSERFGWFSAGDFQPPRGEPLPLALQPEPCALRAMAVRALDGAGISWREALVGGGVTTIGAAAAAGLAVAAMVSRAAPADAEDVTERLGLPALPARDLVLHANLTGANATTLRRIAGAVRAA